MPLFYTKPKDAPDTRKERLLRLVLYLQYVYHH